MAFADHPEQAQVVSLLQRSLERGRLGHAYLLSGSQLETLQTMAVQLAKTLHCRRPPRRADNGQALDSCDACTPCRQIAEGFHADVHWLRPESKSRLITIEQVRDLLHQVQMKPLESAGKVAVVVAADRMNPQAANAFLKSLEEPPARSVLLLLSTEPQRLLETVVSRCLRLSFAGDAGGPREPAVLAWVTRFARTAARPTSGLLNRYELLGCLLDELGRIRAAVEERLQAQSPLERYGDAEAGLRERWENELAAATEAEYRRARSELLSAMHWWLRDVWLITQRLEDQPLSYPEVAAESESVAGRLDAHRALRNLEFIEQTQTILGSNVQEALALEVGLLRLEL